jgi:DNA invertase Pin-like site-specific DNA recombinase
MTPHAPRKLLRCAIYTRKSTEHNLDLEFNSLDAQREACEAYIKSQAHEGWRLVRSRYDDGGLSGASLERPALQGLLGDVRDGKIDVIVVYKVDRLTRSLADFAKLVELFDQHSVSFVSVTQSFNTTTSMGRLTLNVLLSFAQFEREVIGERVRDKIAASKRKGLWVGGPIPLGYATVNKKLVIVPEEAETVRTMFRLYLECGSIGVLAEELTCRNIVSKVRTFASGRVKGGGPYSVGALAHFLKNRFYIGEVVYRGETHPGEHRPIIDRPTFDNARARRVCVESSPAILMGRIFDDRGNRMTPSHSNKDGVRYRYYVSHVLLQRRKKRRRSCHPRAGDRAGKARRSGGPRRGSAGYRTERRSFRSRGDRPLRRAHHRSPEFDRHRIEGTNSGPRAIAGDQCSRSCQRIIYLHHRHQLALERGGVHFRQRSSASARGQADAQTRNPGRDSPRHRQGALLDRRCRIGLRSLVRRDRGA